MAPLKFSVQNLQQAVAAQEKIRRGLKDQGDEVEKITRSTAELGRITTKVQKDTETGQQRLIRLLDQAKAAYNQGTLSVKDWEREQQRLNDAFNESSGEFKKFEDQTESSFGAGALRKLALFAGGFVSIRAAVNAIKLELQATQDLIDRSSTVQTSLVEARSILNQNLVGVSTAERLKIQQDFAAITEAKNLGPDIGTLAGAQALSATGGNIPRAESAVEFATEFSRVIPGNIPSNAFAIASAQQILDTDDPQQAFGLISAVAGLGLVSDPLKQAISIPRALKRAQAFGSTPSGAGAFFAAFTQLGGDTTGEITARFTPQFAEEISEFGFGVTAAEERLDLAARADPTFSSGGFLNQKQIDAIGTASKEVQRRESLKKLSGRGRKGLSTSERVKLLQANPDIAQIFIDTAALQQFKGATTDVLLGGGEEADLLTRFEGLIPSTPEAQRAEGAAQLAGQAVDPLRGRVLQSQAIKGAVQGELLKLPINLLSTEDKEEITQLNQLFGRSRLGAQARTKLSGITGGVGVTFEEATDTLRTLEQFTRRGQREIIPGLNASQTAFPQAGIPGDPVIADSILEVLERMLKESEEQTSAIKRLEGATVGPE